MRSDIRPGFDACQLNKLEILQFINCTIVLRTRIFRVALSHWKEWTGQENCMRLSLSAVAGKYLVIGVILIMTTSLIAGSGLYSFTLNSIDGKPAPLADYKGKVILIVNVASRCGYTPQYSALESVYEKYKAQGFVILGFPANNFGAQEPGTNEEIKTFCVRKYSVTFPMYAKISVKGADQAPLYSYLTKETGAGISGDIKWNFTKFLIDRNGNVVRRFEPPVPPDSTEIMGAIETQLK